MASAPVKEPEPRQSSLEMDKSPRAWISIPGHRQVPLGTDKHPHIHSLHSMVRSYNLNTTLRGIFKM